MRMYRCAQSCNRLECMGIAVDGCCLYRRHTDHCGIHRRDDDAVKDYITTDWYAHLSKEQNLESGEGQ